MLFNWDQKKTASQWMQFFQIYRIFLVPVASFAISVTTAVVAAGMVTFGTGTSYGYRERTSVVFCIVQFFNGMLSFFVVGHLYETVAF